MLLCAPSLPNAFAGPSGSPPLDPAAGPSSAADESPSGDASTLTASTAPSARHRSRQNKQERPIVWQAQQRRRMAVNKAAANALRLQKQLEARCAAAAAEGSPLQLSELLLEPSWRAALAPELASPGFRSLDAFLQAEWAAQRIFPAKPAIFRALNACPLPAVRAVILGQDPYHDDGQAMGLSFSVPRGVAPPSSLQNIFKASSSAALALADSGVGRLIPVPAPAARVPSGRGASRAQRPPARLRLRSAPGLPACPQELETDLGLGRPPHGDLSKWASQGVLLLNTVLTVRAHSANSHKGKGWEAFTDAVIRTVRRRPAPRRPGGSCDPARSPTRCVRTPCVRPTRCRGGLREVLSSCCGASRRRTRSV